MLGSSLFPRRSRKFFVALTAAALAAGGMLATSTSAQASGFSIRISPDSSGGFLFLDVAGASTADGASVIQYSLSGDNQIWTLQPSGGYYQLVNRHSGKCLFADGVVGDWLYQEPCNGSTAEMWSTGLDSSGTGGHILQNPYTGLSADIEGGSSAQGAHLIQWYPDGGSNQYFAGFTA